MHGDTQHCRASPAKAQGGKGSHSCTVWCKCVLFRVPISKDGTMPIFPVHLRFLGISERGRQMLNSTGQSQPLLRNLRSQVKQKRGAGSHDMFQSPPRSMRSLPHVLRDASPVRSSPPCGRWASPSEPSSPMRRRSRPTPSLGPAGRHPPVPASRRSGLVRRPPRGLRCPLTADRHGPERLRGTTAPSRPCGTARRHRAGGSVQHSGR